MRVIFRVVRDALHEIVHQAVDMSDSSPLGDGDRLACDPSSLLFPLFSESFLALFFLSLDLLSPVVLDVFLLLLPLLYSCSESRSSLSSSRLPRLHSHASAPLLRPGDDSRRLLGDCSRRGLRTTPPLRSLCAALRGTQRSEGGCGPQPTA